MSTGVALKSYLDKYVAVHNPPRPRITIDVVAFDWYNAILQGLLDSEAYVWLARWIAVGELLIGLALVLGVLVGITASFSLFTSLNLGLAGLGTDQLLLPPRLARVDLRMANGGVLWARSLALAAPPWRVDVAPAHGSTLCCTCCSGCQGVVEYWQALLRIASLQALFGQYLKTQRLSASMTGRPLPSG